MKKMFQRRAKMTSSSGSSKKFSEMRITLLGHQGSGKSSSGNTILGSESEQFSLEPTGQCEKRQGDVAGRHLTVVDTPGWFIDKPLKRTSELIKQEIVVSSSMCPPGPHGVLLAIPAGLSLPADQYKNMEDHMQLLSESVWDHTMILFSHGDCLGGRSIEQYIESEGKALQSLVDKCGNRYHAFNNENRGDDTQVTRLLEKIEQMVAGEEGGCFEMDRRVLEETEKKMRTQDEGATRRQMKVKKQRESIRSKMGDDLHLSEMRITLLGYKSSGKSSSGNTILGSESEQFSLETTGQCEKRRGDVAGRHLTVVDTPGWFYNSPLNRTSELIKQEIVVSSSLCPPGPHGVLLAIGADQSYEADWYKNMEDHMQLLSESVWDHTMILFSHGDCLGGRSIEQYIESEGKALQSLVDKCGNRYHVFSNDDDDDWSDASSEDDLKRDNNENRGDDTQVTRLLEKIEQMVAGEKGGCFEMDRRVLEETEKKRRTQDEGATRRQMKVKKQRESIRSKMGDDLHLSEMRITLLGSKASGKSSSGNTILGSESEQFSLERTGQCEKRQGDVAGRHLTVVNTPGWFINAPLNLTSELIKQEIVRSVSLCPPGPHGVLLAMRAGESRPADIYKYMEEHMQLLSESVWDHTMILFSGGDCLRGRSIEHYIESEGKALQSLVDKCGNRYHVINNKNRGDDTQVTELLEKIEQMVAGNGHYGTGSPAAPTPASGASSSVLSGGASSSVPAESDQVEKLTALLKERERELQNSITAMEESKREQQKLTQDQKDRAEKLAAQMKQKEDTIKEMEDSKRDLQKLAQDQQEQRDQVEKLTALLEESKREQQKLTQDQKDHAEKLAAQMKQKEDAIKEMEDSKRDLQQLAQDVREQEQHKLIQDQQEQRDQVEKLTALLEEREREQQKLTQDQKDHAEKLAAQMKQKEDAIKEMEDSKRDLQKLSQDQKDRAEKLAAQMKQKEDTIKEMTDSKTQEQKRIQEQQEQKDHADMIAAQMKEMKSELSEMKITQRQMEAEQKRASATPQHLTPMVTAGAEDRLMSARKEFIQRISEPSLNELLDELLDKKVITGEELDTAMAKIPTQNKARHVIDMVRKKGNKASSFMIDMIIKLDHNLSEVLQLKPPCTD